MERQEYTWRDFDEDPAEVFLKWRQEAIEEKCNDPDAMTLATIDENQRPTARIILYKGLKQGGFVFFTNYKSAKASFVEKNPFAALVFYWPQLYKQIRIEGKLQKISRQESEEYFATRPRESQIGAWASDQSCAISDYADLKSAYAHYEKSFLNKTVPCPPHWGGFVLQPEKFEFWVGQLKRLHQRFVFKKTTTGWLKQMLAP